MLCFVFDIFVCLHLIVRKIIQKNICVDFAKRQTNLTLSEKNVYDKCLIFLSHIVHSICRSRHSDWLIG